MCASNTCRLINVLNKSVAMSSENIIGPALPPGLNASRSDGSDEDDTSMFKIMLINVANLCNNLM